jgi:SnoaL-like protein
VPTFRQVCRSVKRFTPPPSGGLGYQAHLILEEQPRLHRATPAPSAGAGGPACSRTASRSGPRRSTARGAENTGKRRRRRASPNSQWDARNGHAPVQSGALLCYRLQYKGRHMNRRHFALTGLATLTTTQTAHAQATPSARQNRATIERFVAEILNAGNYDAAHDLIAADFQPTGDNGAPGIDACISRGTKARKRNDQQFDGGYSYEVGEILADKDSGAVRLSLAIARAGKQITVPSMVWFAFDQSGLIASTWSLVDNDTIMNELFG